MSMISSLIDELRQMADLYDALQKPAHVRVLRDAADTIWQLRDDLQRANAAVQDAEHDESMAWDRVRKTEAENAKLRDELEAVGTAAYLYGRTDLEAENAKLRELCKRVLKNCYDAYEQVWGWDDDWVILCDEARKLGVEVDE